MQKKIYIGTLIEVGHDSGQTFVQTHTASDAYALAAKIENALNIEREETGLDIVFDWLDLLIECTNGNQHNEPLSIDIEGEPYGHEFLLSTKIQTI